MDRQRSPAVDQQGGVAHDALDTSAPAES